jgi:ADP-ribose pyrophosphatase
MEILDVEKLTDQKWLNLFAATYRHHGKNGRWVYASRKQATQPHQGTADAVVIVPILKVPPEEPRLVILREFRVPVASYLYGFPAGLLEGGESIEEAVSRELLEETGLEVTAYKTISPPLFSSAGLTDESVVVVFVDARPVPGAKPKLDSSEEIEVVLLTWKQVDELCRCKELFDSRAWMGLYLYAQLGRLE